jgi:hypothetical protein
MSSLEGLLDREVDIFVNKIEKLDEYKDLRYNNISNTCYIRFLSSFYIMESLSADAVNKASENTRDTDPYLSRRFDYCAEGERDHADVAIADLKAMGVKELHVDELNNVKNYRKFLLKGADEFPAQIIGHSYIFENSSAIIFPQQNKIEKPFRFIELHANEDPGHSLAIKRTVRKIEVNLSEVEKSRIAEFARKSGEFFLEIFEQL